MKDNGEYNITMKLNRNEAFNAWANRYMKERRKKLIIFLAVSIIATIVFWSVMYTREMIYSETSGYSWWAMAMMVPIMVKALMTSKASGKYARGKLK